VKKAVSSTGIQVSTTYFRWTTGTLRDLAATTFHQYLLIPLVWTPSSSSSSIVVVNDRMPRPSQRLLLIVWRSCRSAQEEHTTTMLYWTIPAVTKHSSVKRRSSYRQSPQCSWTLQRPRSTTLADSCWCVPDVVWSSTLLISAGTNTLYFHVNSRRTTAPDLVHFRNPRCNFLISYHYN